MGLVGGSTSSARQSTRRLQVPHVLPAATMASSVVFDEPNLIAHAGLIPALALAEQAGLFDLARQHLTLTGPGSAYAAEKIAVLVAGAHPVGRDGDLLSARASAGMSPIRQVRLVEDD